MFVEVSSESMLGELIVHDSTRWNQKVKCLESDVGNWMGMKGNG